MSRAQLKNRTNGKRERTVNLDGLHDYAPSQAVSVDWEAAMNELGLTEAERRYFAANKLERVPRREVGAFLGWHPAQVNRVRVSVDRKIAKARYGGRSASDFLRQSGLSSNPLVLETLSPGHEVYSIPHISHLEEEIYAVRAKNITGWKRFCAKTEFSAPKYVGLLPKAPGAAADSGAGGSGERPTETNQGESTTYMEPTLEIKLRHERTRLDKLIVNGQTTERDIEKAAATRGQLQRAILKSQEDAILLDDAKPLSADVQKKLQASEAQFNDAVTRHEAYRRAISIQHAAIAEIENEIAANRMQRIAAEVLNPAEEARAAMEVFLEKTERLYALCARNGVVENMTNGLVPLLSARWEDGYEARSRERMFRVAMFNAAIGVLGDRAQYTDYEVAV